MLESDVLWSSYFETRHEEFRRTWLRLASDINQSGFPVAIFGAGFAVPHNIETTPERSSFSEVHYLALTCDDDVLTARIRARKAPRCTDDAHVAEHVEFNQWVRSSGPTSKPAVSIVDTTRERLDVTANSVEDWMRDRLSAFRRRTT